MRTNNDLSTCRRHGYQVSTTSVLSTLSAENFRLGEKATCTRSNRLTDNLIPFLSI
jgi:hypothetical protein